MTVPDTRRVEWWWMPAFAVAAFIFFWPVLSFTPFSDDHSALWNSGVRGIPWRNGFFRPLSDLTFRVGYWLFGTRPSAHHAFNIGVHALNTYLLFAFCKPWSDRLGALFAAALFLVYPFHQESIVWLVGRESALGTTAVLLGLVVVGSARPLVMRLMLMAGCLLLGALFYESALLLLPLSLVIAWSGLFPRWPRWRPVAFWLGSSGALYLLLRAQVIGPEAGGYMQDLFPNDLRELMQNIPKALARLFLPPEADSSIQVVRGALLGLVVIVLVLVLRRSNLPTVVRGRSVLLLLLILISSTIAVAAGVSTVTSESDRFLYLPSTFLCALIGSTLSRSPAPFVRSGVVALLVILSLWQTKANHANWSRASSITAQCLTNLPAIPHGAKLWVQDLPQEADGAFIFRNGFPEAVDLSGKEGSRVVVVPLGTPEVDVWTHGVTYRGEQTTISRDDVWYRWNDGVFRSITIGGH